MRTIILAIIGGLAAFVGLFLPRIREWFTRRRLDKALGQRDAATAEAHRQAGEAEVARARAEVAEQAADAERQIARDAQEVRDAAAAADTSNDPLARIRAIDDVLRAREAADRRGSQGGGDTDSTVRGRAPTGATSRKPPG